MVMYCSKMTYLHMDPSRGLWEEGHEEEPGMAFRIHHVLRAPSTSLELDAQNSWVPLARPVQMKPRWE